MPWASSHAGTSPRRPVVATTRSAARTVPSSSRTPVTVGRPVGGRLAARRRRRRGRATRSTPGLGEDRAAHDPLEGGAPARAACAGRRRPASTASVASSRVMPWSLRIGARLDAEVGERLQHVGEAVAQDRAGQAEEHVRVPHLRRARAVPVEGGLGVGGHRRVVALDERDAVAGAGERERGAEAADAGADDDDVEAVHQPSASTAAEQAAGPGAGVLVVAAHHLAVDHRGQVAGRGLEDAAGAGGQVGAGVRRLDGEVVEVDHVEVGPAARRRPRRGRRSRTSPPARR